MDKRHAKYAMIFAAIFVVGAIAGDTMDVLEKRYIAPEQYTQKEEQDYRDKMQLEIQGLKDRIKTLEGAQNGDE